MPEAPPFESCDDMPSPLTPWTRRYSFRFVEGALEDFPRTDGAIRSGRTLCHLRDKPERPLDFQSLAALSDAFFLRIMHVRGTRQPMATVSLTTYFHADSADLRRLGASPLLGEADAAIFRGGFADQTCRLWAPDGRLVANGVQITWYKE